MRFLDRLKVLLREPQGFFLAVSLIFGGIFLLIIPPLQTPDESSHFLRVYQLSQFHLAPTIQDNIVGGELPRSLSKTIKLLDTNPSLRFHAETKYDIHRTAEVLHMPLNKQDTMFTSGVTGYAPVGYIPQSIGVFLGSLINLPAIVLMYIARLMSLLVWIALIFTAITIVPYRKWAFVAVGLLPMLVAQAVSPGIDAMSIGLGVLFIASVLFLRTKTRIPTKWWVGLLVIACLIALTKQTTILVLGFVFLLKLSQFDTKRWKSYLKKALLLLLPAFLLVGWSLVSLSVESPVPGQDSGAQLSNIIHTPLRLPQVLFNTFFTTWGDDVVRSLIGNFGWIDTPLAGGIVAIGYIFIAAILFIGYESINKKLSRIHKILLLLLTFLYVIGTCTALYLLYSPVNFDVIYGLQGRYFLLVLFMLIPVFAVTSIKMPRKSYIKLVRIGSLFLIVASALTIYLRYYVELF